MAWRVAYIARLVELWVGGLGMECVRLAIGSAASEQGEEQDGQEEETAEG